MLIIEVMTRNPETVAPNDTIQTAAQLMDELNVGALPVVEGPAETSAAGRHADRSRHRHPLDRGRRESGDRNRSKRR